MKKIVPEPDSPLITGSSPKWRRAWETEARRPVWQTPSAPFVLSTRQSRGQRAQADSRGERRASAFSTSSSFLLVLSHGPHSIILNQGAAARYSRELMELIKKILDFILHIDRHLGEIIADYGIWTYLILFAIIFVETG